MQERISFTRASELFPPLPRTLQALGKNIRESALDINLVHLLEIRASQINGCAFCMNMHLQAAREHGEDQQRLDTLAGWRDAPFFSEPERVALHWCERLTRLPDGPPEDGAWHNLQRHFSPEQIMALTASVIVINSWNRLILALHLKPERRQHRKQPAEEMTA